jgi:uncharacterized protein YbgA (DUF1722 family)/uncharacterized protein YbbK (DUF523 family)
MRHFERPKLVVSACLGFRACRYNGQSLPQNIVATLEAHVDFVPVCPEIVIGLGVPRDPVRVVLDGPRRLLHQPATGRDFAAAMEGFCEGYLSQPGPVDGFLLKSRSPSCGIKDVKIYTSPEAGTRTTRGSGFFGGAVLNRFPGHPVEDEGRLLSFSIREHYLIRLFSLAAFRQVRSHGTVQELIRFHTRHKLLLLAYNQARMRALGRVVASYDKHNLPEVLDQYEGHLRQALANAPKYTSMINLLTHAFGGLSRGLSAGERRFFLNTIEEYRDERVPLSVPAHLLEAWAVRQGNSYLLEQSFLRPYPRELAETSDSGKGHDH